MAKQVLGFVVILSMLFVACDEGPTESDPDTWIRIVVVNPSAGTVVTGPDTISARLSYSFSSRHQSPFGFAVSIKFASTTSGMRFSNSDSAYVPLIDSVGMVSLNYPLSMVWSDTRLKHPVSCAFLLHKYTLADQSTIIAETGWVNYLE